MNNKEDFLGVSDLFFGDFNGISNALCNGHYDPINSISEFNSSELGTDYAIFDERVGHLIEIKHSCIIDEYGNDITEETMSKRLSNLQESLDCLTLYSSFVGYRLSSKGCLYFAERKIENPFTFIEALLKDRKYKDVAGLTEHAYCKIWTLKRGK